MKSLLENKNILLISRVILGFVFIIAGIEKISDPNSFAQNISNYRMLPIFSLNFVAIVLPWLEVISGILLIYGLSVKDNSAIIGGLLIIFNVMVFIAMIRGLDIDCGCFGTSDGQKVGFLKLFENFGLILLSLHIIFFYKKSYTLEK